MMSVGLKFFRGCPHGADSSPHSPESDPYTGQHPLCGRHKWIAPYFKISHYVNISAELTGLITVVTIANVCGPTSQDY